MDNAAGSWPKPAQVRRAVANSFQNYGANPGRGAYRLSLDTARMVYDVRSRLTELVGGEDPERLIFTSGATTAANLALKGWLRPGDHVIYSGMEHNAIYRPLKQLEDKGLISTDCIEADADGYIDPDDFAAAIRDETRLLVCLHASNVTGSVQPVAGVGKLSKKTGIPLLVDAAQSAGALPINCREMGISFLVLAGHKALYGPPGIGALYAAPGLEPEPLISGGTGSHSHQWQQPPEWPERHESGTINVPGIAGLGGSLDFLRDAGPEWLLEFELELAGKFAEGASLIPGIRLYLPQDERPRAPLVSLNLNKMDPGEAAFLLDRDYGIAVRSGLHCTPLAHQAIGSFPTGTVRFSFGYFNTLREVKTVLFALNKLSHKY
ncbi:MAG: aminotransferase class V-fold PLP-dependent enzyme [Clostridiales bacterium]|nr:aminotransferase class V-fold PLP-dependent enzyme [Clostridiales bacterium]